MPANVQSESAWGTLLAIERLKKVLFHFLRYAGTGIAHQHSAILCGDRNLDCAATTFCTDPINRVVEQVCKHLGDGSKTTLHFEVFPVDMEDDLQVLQCIHERAARRLDRTSNGEGTRRLGAS